MQDLLSKLTRGFAKALLIVGASLFLSFVSICSAVVGLTDDVFKQLGCSPDVVNNTINWNFINGTFQYFGKNLHDRPAAERIAIMNGLVSYARKYLTTSDFKAFYKRQRDMSKPKPIPPPEETAKIIRAREKERLERNLEAAEQSLQSTNPKLRNGAPMRIENIKKELAALDDPNNKIIKQKLDDLNARKAYIQSENEKNLKKWEARYPENTQVLLKQRLQEILDITADVDYSAELVERPYRGKTFQYFSNPEYEKKPAEWKLAFRAGKPLTDAVRAAAQQWLKELK